VSGWIWCAAFTILGVALLWCIHQNRRQPPPPTRLERLLAEHHTAERDRIDSMIDVVRDREQPPHNHAWPPETTVPPVPAPRVPDDAEFDEWLAEWERRFAE
jgi:hypothetical protein